MFKSRWAKIRERKLYLLYAFIFVIALSVIILGFISIIPKNESSIANSNEGEFPDFITKNEDYFITRIGDVPNINPDTYTLNIWGEIDNPKTFNLTELQELDLVERMLTTECIGNPANGPLLSTTVWKGSDGYYVSHTLDQLRDNGTIGALYMNNYTLPPAQGFPLRIVNPGAFGAKQPAWVIEIEVMDRPLEDFWDDQGWDTSPPMDVDSTIFFPNQVVFINSSDTLRIGGAAFGGTRISKIEYTIDGGIGWNEVIIINSIDVDHVWVFWEVNITLHNPGSYTFYTKATDIFNNTQPMFDPTGRDGTNSWPRLIIQVQ
ncbi:MAG: molybdopterin-dependent oxidoreductase [Promethearchaeota archaeon]|jgi:hypothetical protein